MRGLNLLRLLPFLGCVACPSDYEILPETVEPEAPVEEAEVLDPADPVEEEDEPSETPDDPESTGEVEVGEGDCEGVPDLIYVVTSDDRKIYLFDPPSLSLTEVGQPDCATSESPHSMAVSRLGHAYVRYADDAVFDVDLLTMECERTPYAPDSTGIGPFGMGYARDDVDTTDETLFIASYDGLATLDVEDGSIHSVGRSVGIAELTGTSDGELWAYRAEGRPALIELDKSTGAALETLPLSLLEPDAITTYALANWGGDFYVFARENGIGTTDVYEVTRDGDMTKVVDDIGVVIIGAGVSTCEAEE